MTTVAELLPGTGAIFLLLGEADITTPRAVGVLVGWAVGTLLLGGLRLLRADADR